MTSKRLYEIADQFGMVGGDVDLPKTNSIVDVINFVADLTTYNDIECIKNLLVAVIVEMNNEENK